MTQASEPTTGENQRSCPDCGESVSTTASFCAHCGGALSPGAQVINRPAAQSGSGLEPNMAAALCYLLTWVTGLIFLLVEKENEYVRFHAKQAIAFGIATCAIWLGLSIFFTVIAFVPFIGGILAGVLGTLVWFVFGIGSLVIWVMMMVKAYQGQRYELPVLSNLVKNWSARLAH